MSVERGFCTNRQQLTDLLKFGLPERSIYLQGRGAEDLEICLDSFRGRKGRLILAQDLRVFGPSKRAVAEQMANLETAGIHVTDILHPEDVTVTQLIQRAQVAISGARFRDRRLARRQGARGGLGKGVGAQVARAGHAPKWLVDRIVDNRDIPWTAKVELLAPHFSESTLRRHYGSTPTRAKP